VYLAYVYQITRDPNDPGTKTSTPAADSANPDVALAGREVVVLGSIGSAPCINYPAGPDCIPADEVTHTLDTLQDSLREDQP
jgi:hypothetical protein